MAKPQLTPPKHGGFMAEKKRKKTKGTVQIPWGLKDVMMGSSKEVTQKKNK